jgi:hypothetical protein
MSKIDEHNNRLRMLSKEIVNVSLNSNSDYL